MKKENNNLINPIIWEPIINEFVPVDQWIPNDEDKIFKTSKGVITLDVSKYFGLDERRDLNAFIISLKRSYNNPKMREHTVHYLNYFEKFYDLDHELLIIYYRLKYLIDYEPMYTMEAFFYDLNRYILHGNIAIKVGYMNRDNYMLSLTYKNRRNNGLQTPIVPCYRNIAVKTSQIAGNS